jgi:hypothetical protein
MLIFINKEKDTYFAVNNETSEVIYVAPRELSILKKFSKMLGDLDYLELPNFKTVQKFRNLVKKGILNNIAFNNTKQYFLDNYPELFI